MILLGNLTITEPQKSDLKSLLKILESTGWFEDLTSENEDCMKSGMAVLESILSDTNKLLLVARDGCRVVGFVCLHFVPYLMLCGEEAFLSELFVKNTHCGKGIGSMLLAAAVEAAKERGCRRMQLINSRLRDSYRRGFYAKHGWQERQYAASFILNLYDKTREPEPGK